MKYVMTLLVVVAGSPAWARISWGTAATPTPGACVESYRKAYIELGRTNDEKLRGAAEVYSIYFDHKNGITIIQNQEQRQLNDFIVDSMESGKLCTSLGNPRTYNQVLDMVIDEFKKEKAP